MKMPDFETWSDSLFDGLYKRKDYELALKQAFDQGRSLGIMESIAIRDDKFNELYDQGYEVGYKDAIDIQKERDELLNTQEMWYDAIDIDEKEYIRWQDNEKLVVLMQEGVVQKRDKASGCYVARYINTGIEIGRRCGGQPFANILIEE